jgi:hypothetical protein
VGLVARAKQSFTPQFKLGSAPVCAGVVDKIKAQTMPYYYLIDFII